MVSRDRRRGGRTELARRLGAACLCVALFGDLGCGTSEVDPVHRAGQAGSAALDGGSGGTAGSAASGGSAGSAGTSDAGSCNAAFCPNPGFGTPCCVTADGPCGMDQGMGCVSMSGDAG